MLSYRVVLDVPLQRASFLAELLADPVTRTNRRQETQLKYSKKIVKYLMLTFSVDLSDI